MGGGERVAEGVAGKTVLGALYFATTAVAAAALEEDEEVLEAFFAGSSASAAAVDFRFLVRGGLVVVAVGPKSRQAGTRLGSTG